MTTVVDTATLIFKGRRFWIYKAEKSGFTSYILTTAFRYDNWLLIENVYPDGDIIRHWRNVGYTFDFARMTWVKD